MHGQVEEVGCDWPGEAYHSCCSYQAELDATGYLDIYASPSSPQAFGNAKTNRNDNSSRFGKYMDVQFDFRVSSCCTHIRYTLLQRVKQPSVLAKG